EEERHAWVKSTHDEQRALVAQDADTFFVPPYVGPSGWVGVVIHAVDREEMQELVTEAWRLTAPKRLLAAFAGEAGPMLLVRCPPCGPRHETAPRSGGHTDLTQPSHSAAYIGPTATQ